MSTSLFSLVLYVTGECHRFLHTALALCASSWGILTSRHGLITIQLMQCFKLSISIFP